MPRSYEVSKSATKMPQKRVAILGGSLSGIAVARRIAKDGHRCDLFRNLFDPARSIHTPHPLCEYQAASFLLREDDSDAFQNEVKLWFSKGLLDEATNFRVGRCNGTGSIDALNARGRRLKPKGGFQCLCDALCRDFAKYGTVDPRQLSKMSWCDYKGQTGWWLEDIHGSFAGPYDVVLCAFDQLPRACRKASFKQLLESALPRSEKVMACVGRAQQASSMAVVVSFDPPLDIPWDSLVLDGVPELQMVARNPKDDQVNRGMNAKGDTWTLVSTTAWSYETRPTHTGNWNKNQVGNAMVKALGKVVKKDTTRHRMVVPTFHWQGASGITRVSDDFSPCIFDADSGLGWCGDIFGGIGPAGAVASGAALATEFQEWSEGRPAGALPGDGAWVPRTVRPDDDDVASITGPSTARREPRDGLDHTWPAAAKLAAGFKVAAGVDSMKAYRSRGVLAQDKQRSIQTGIVPPVTQALETRSQAEAGDVFRPGPRQASRKMSLRCQVIDEGLFKVSQLSKPVREELLAGVFPKGAHGVCGGLYDERTGCNRVGDADWQVVGSQEASWSEMGLHGNHVVDVEQVERGLLEEILSEVRSVFQGDDQSALSNFAPDTVRVAFETMNGRTIGRGQTLCGWSKDGDAVCGQGPDTKVLVMLGSAKVTIGFKYTKADRESLDVDMHPGDMLVLSGPARTWVSAVVGVETAVAGSAPFDFVHLWLCDHRPLKRCAPDTYRAIHSFKTPRKGDASYKWMQYEYKVASSGAIGDCQVLISEPGSSQQSMYHQQPDSRRVFIDEHDANKSQVSGRRWHNKR